MLNVLIVDDDKLVRKGLAVTMPWSAFGMTIVGEAGNGVAALEFLQHRGVDLLVTDLVMPYTATLIPTFTSISCPK